MDIISSMKYQVVHLSVNMVQRHRWLIILKYFLHHFSIGVCIFHKKLIITFDTLLDSRNYNQEGYGEFGFQVALSEKPERIIITSPGSFYFRGKSERKIISRKMID